jgi:hypothetical protein
LRQRQRTMVTATMATMRRHEWTDRDPALTGAQVRQWHAAAWSNLPATR